jgi:hypothetical protein
VSELEIELLSIPRQGEVFACARTDTAGAYEGFTHVTPQYVHAVDSVPAIAGLDAVPDALRAVPPLRFREGDVTAGDLRIALAGDRLALHLSSADVRTASSAVPWAVADNPWNGPVFGILADTAEPTIIRQVVLFPDGSGQGTVWAFHGADRVPPPAVAWRTSVRADGGYDLVAVIPLAALGIDAAVPFRFQAMLGVQAPGQSAARVLPLVGSTVSYNDSQRFCIHTSVPRLP